MRILVIEDNTDIAANLGDYLEDRGHTVEVIRPENVGHCWHIPSNQRLWEFLSRHRLKDPAVTTSEP